MKKIEGYSEEYSRFPEQDSGFPAFHDIQIKQN